MLSLPFAVCLLFLFVTPTASQPFRRSSADVRREVIGVVESQFTAFKDGDYARAYSFAAAGIQQQFNVKQFNSNIVARWEYRPASALFVVWQQGRAQSDLHAGTFDAPRDVRDLFAAHPDNTLLVKLSWWFTP